MGLFRNKLQKLANLKPTRVTDQNEVMSEEVTNEPVNEETVGVRNMVQNWINGLESDAPNPDCQSERGMTEPVRFSSLRQTDFDRNPSNVISSQILKIGDDENIVRDVPFNRGEELNKSLNHFHRNHVYLKSQEPHSDITEELNRHVLEKIANEARALVENSRYDLDESQITIRCQNQITMETIDCKMSQEAGNDDSSNSERAKFNSTLENISKEAHNIVENLQLGDHVKIGDIGDCIRNHSIEDDIDEYIRTLETIEPSYVVKLMIESLKDPASTEGMYARYMLNRITMGDEEEYPNDGNTEST